MKHDWAHFGTVARKNSVYLNWAWWSSEELSETERSSAELNGGDFNALTSTPLHLKKQIINEDTEINNRLISV